MTTKHLWAALGAAAAVRRATLVNSVLPEREAALAAAETALAAATAASTTAKEVRVSRYVYPLVDVSIVTQYSSFIA